MELAAIKVEGLEVFDLIQKVLNHFAGPLFKEDIKKAKAEFFDNSGVLEEHTQLFEVRMQQFFDWYFFTRPLSGFGQTPLHSVFLTRELRLPESENQIVEQLRKHRHGIFEFIKMKSDELMIRDLFSGEKLKVKKSFWSDGFDSQEFFEARLIPTAAAKGDFFFTRGLCFHPKEGKKFILEEIKRHKKNPDLNHEDFFLRLLKMRYKFERYRHVKIEMIYSSENKLGL